MSRVAKLGALALVVGSLTLALSTGSAKPSPAQTAFSIKSTICGVLGAADKVSLPHDIYTLATEGKIEALGAMLFGTNLALCGTGDVEELFSFGRDFITKGLFQNDPAFAKLDLNIPTLLPKLQQLPALSIAPVSVPAVTFSGASVGFGLRVPLTVSWYGSPSVRDVYIKAVALSPGLVTQYRRRLQITYAGQYLIPLKGGTWKLCMSETSRNSGYSCGFPFTVHIDGQAAQRMNQILATGPGYFPFTGSQVGVIVETSDARASFNVDHRFGTYRTFDFTRTDKYGRRAWYFVYWAWSFGWGSHDLNMSGSSAAGHIIDFVYIS